MPKHSYIVCLTTQFIQTFWRKMMIGEKIKAARRKARLSQEQVGAKAGVARTQISKLERNELRLDMVRWGTLRKLCDTLDLTPNDLLGYTHASHD
jgi:transcriptional regulator with XRE-family HTH domain